jgi:hypothetical protein
MHGRHDDAIRMYTAALALDKWRPEIWTRCRATTNPQPVPPPALCYDRYGL